MLFDGRVTPVGSFLLALAAALEGAEISGAASDRYRRSEVLQALEAESLEWPWSWRGMGTGLDGSADVRAFQRIILRGEFRTVPSLLMPLALKSTLLRRDGNGNPALERGNTGRIDILSANRFGRWARGGFDWRFILRDTDSGMNRIEQKKFYQTPAWRRASRACRAAAGWLCVRCKAKGFTVAAALAHHKTPLDAGGAKFGPLEALCRICHESEHGRAPNEEQRAWSKYLSHLRETI